MKTTFIFTILLLISCGSNNREDSGNVMAKESGDSIEKDSGDLNFDTIVIDYNLQNQLEEQRNLLFEKLEMGNLVDSLKSICLLQGIQELNEEGLPFGYPKDLSKFYLNNLPKTIYEKIFPSEEIQVEKMRYSSPEVNTKNKTVTIRLGPKITEERKYKSLLSLIEKEDYLQLLLTKQGKYAPEIEMVTIFKDDLKLVDQLNLYGGIYDSYDINYWHSEILNGFDELVLTKVENKKFDDIDLDTTLTRYTISDQGEILKNN